MSVNSYEIHWDHIEANWDTFKPRAKEKWQELSYEELDAIEGKRDKMIAKLRETYGLSQREAEAELSEFSFPQNVT